MYRRYKDTLGLETVWSRARKTVSHGGTYIEVNALANRKPVKGVPGERREEIWENICDVHHMRQAAAMKKV